ncbi:MAG: hypothetical protein ABUL44_01825, partial [Flavobacterium sp.]
MKLGAIGGVAATAAGTLGIFDVFSEELKPESGEKIRLLSQDGKIVEVDSSYINPAIPDVPLNVR